MNLEISIVDRKPKRFNDDPYVTVRGYIKIGDFEEGFYSPLAWWSAQDYEYQWQQGLRRLNNYDTSCLITSIYDPQMTKYLMWWLLYKVDNKVYIQNQMLFDEIYEKQIDGKVFTLETCYDFIPPRYVEENLGDQKVSEWVIDYP
jgi:hypothetical protein